MKIENVFLRWMKNYLLVILVAGFTFIHFWVTLVPGKMSCWLRINCVNEDNTSASVYNGGPVAIQNDYNSTLMPVEFRRFLAVLMAVNFMSVLAWEFFIVGHGYGKKMWFYVVSLFGGDEEAPEGSTAVVYTGEMSKSQDPKLDDSKRDASQSKFED